MAENAEFQVFARAKTEAATDLSSDTDSGRGCWFPLQFTHPEGFETRGLRGLATGRDTYIAILDGGVDVFHPGLFDIDADMGSGSSPRPWLYKSRIVAYWDTYLEPAVGSDLRKQTKDFLKKIGVTKPYGTVFFQSDIGDALKEYYDKNGDKKVASTFPEHFKHRPLHGTTSALMAASHGSLHDLKKPMGTAPLAKLIIARRLGTPGAVRKYWGKDTGPRTAHVRKHCNRFATYIAHESPDFPRGPLVINKSFGDYRTAPAYDNIKTKAEVGILNAHPNGTAIVTSSGNFGYRSMQRHFETRTRTSVGSPTHAEEMQAAVLHLVDNRKKKAMRIAPGKYKPVRGTFAIHIFQPDGSYSDMVFGVAAPTWDASGAINNATNGLVSFGKCKASGAFVGSASSATWLTDTMFLRSRTGLAVPGYKTVPLSLMLMVTKRPIEPGSSDQLVSIYGHLETVGNPTSSTRFKTFKKPFKIKFVFRAPTKTHVNVFSQAQLFESDKPYSGVTVALPEFANWNGTDANKPTFSRWAGPAIETEQKHQLRGRAAVRELVTVGAYDGGKPHLVTDASMGGPVHDYVPPPDGPKTRKPEVVAPGDMRSSVIPSKYRWHKDKTSVQWPSPKAMSGTSFAAPLVSGIIAMGFELKPDATAAEVQTWLSKGAYVPSKVTATKLPAYQNRAGWGAVDGFNTVKKAKP